MNMHIQKQDKITHLGANSDYPDQYAPALLEALPRARGRDLIGVDERQLPFSGFDLWTAFELSSLNAKGKPVVGIGEFTFPHSSSNLIESKSFKLYLNSFNQTRFDSVEQVSAAMQKDLSQAANGESPSSSIRGWKVTRRRSSACRASTSTIWISRSTTSPSNRNT